MIEYTSGDILTEDAEALVNTVNCVGVMGRGIALQFKKAYPENFKAYAEACKLDEVQPGRMFIHRLRGLTNPRYIINFPTKRHWRGKSRMEDIDSGLAALTGDIRKLGIRSVAVPPLGSGLGGLEWTEVRDRIEGTLGGLNDVRVVVYEPNGAPPADVMARVREVPEMTTSRATLVALMDNYIAGLLDPFVTLLELHKLMYFMQEASEPLKLQFAKAQYGPYAKNLRHVLNKIEGHMVSGYADGADAPLKPLELVPGAVQDAAAFLADKPDTLARSERVSELVDGFESPFGLELLSTVHWVVKHDDVHNLEEITRGVHAWGQRKTMFSERQVGIAHNVLVEHGWLPAA